MEKFFNNAGPIQKDIHYSVEPLSRINLDEIESLISQRKYFVLHAPRQTGKTSMLLALRDYLNAKGKVYCVYANVEAGQAMRNDVKKDFQRFFRENAESWDKHFDYREAGPQMLLQTFLQRIVNGGGYIDREYGLGQKRTELLIRKPLTEHYGGPVQKIVLELKIKYKSLEN